ncbi:MAG: hypothetical protein ACPGCS_03675 [Opitutales bacterium]|jgi:hypothetical protein
MSLLTDGSSALEAYLEIKHRWAQHWLSRLRHAVNVNQATTQIKPLRPSRRTLRQLERRYKNH